MPYLRQLLLGLACASLFACAAGVPGDELDFAPDETPLLDAGLPPLATSLPPQLSGPILQPAAAQPTAANPSVSQSSSAASVPSTSSSTSASTPTTSAPSTSTPSTSTATTSTPTMSTAPSTTPTVSTQDAGTSSSSTRDAGVSTPATPPPAPMCVANKCNINCALLLPCCDQKGQCMCLSPIRGCVLPPL